MRLRFMSVNIEISGVFRKLNSAPFKLFIYFDLTT